MSEFDALDDAQFTRGRSAAGSIATVALAAAVGAGVALLFTTEAGERTRERIGRRVRDLELGERASRLSDAALGGFERVRDEAARAARQYYPQPAPTHNALYATLGTVAGAALAALLTPHSGRESREWLGNTFDDIRENASLRWREHRARRDQPVEPVERTDEALRRMEGNGEA